jgi:hypothetical protein
MKKPRGLLKVRNGPDGRKTMAGLKLEIEQERPFSSVEE